MKQYFKAFVIFLICYSGPSISVEVKGLFEAEVITKSQSHVDRNKAIRDALVIVLEKIMAGEGVLDNPTIQAALNDATRFTTQYQYSLAPSGVDNDSSTRIMRVKFDQDTLIDLIRLSNLGVWSEMRDETLLWLVVDEDSKRKIFNEEQMPEIANALSKAAKRKGLPLLYPLMDLEERQQISVNDILSAYSERLYEVSERYGAAAMLIGRIDKNKKCWKSEWAFYFDHEVKQWTEQCSPLDQAILSGIQGAYNRLSIYYAVKPERLELGTVILKVSGIKGMTALSRVTNYLSALPMTKAVNWLKVESDVNYYKVKTSGSRRSFENAVGLGRVLDPLDTSKQKNNELEYKLLPEKIR